MRRITLHSINLACCLPLLLGAQFGWMVCIHSCGVTELTHGLPGLEDAHCASGHCATDAESSHPGHELADHRGDACGDRISCPGCADDDLCLDILIQLGDSSAPTSVDLPLALALQPSALDGVGLAWMKKTERRQQDPPSMHEQMLASVVLLL